MSRFLGALLVMCLATPASGQEVTQKVEMEGAVANAVRIATDDFIKLEGNNLACFTVLVEPKASDFRVHFSPKNLTFEQLPDDNIRIERHDRCGTGVSYTIDENGRIASKWHMR